MPESIKSQSIIPRIDGIERDIQKLGKLGGLPFEEFEKEDNFIKAQFFFVRPWRAYFISPRIFLPEFPGGRATEYKEIALKLGEVGVVDKDFADHQLKSMAGYRNRLTHFYAEITAEEIYKIIQENLGDFDVFLKAIRRLMKHPEEFNLRIE